MDKNDFEFIEYYDMFLLRNETFTQWNSFHALNSQLFTLSALRLCDSESIRNRHQIVLKDKCFISAPMTSLEIKREQ